MWVKHRLPAQPVDFLLCRSGVGLKLCISTQFPGEVRLPCGDHMLSYCRKACERDIDKFRFAQPLSPFEGLLWDVLQVAKCQLSSHRPHFNAIVRCGNSSKACLLASCLIKRALWSEKLGRRPAVVPSGSSQCTSAWPGRPCSEKATKPWATRHLPDPFSALCAAQWEAYGHTWVMGWGQDAISIVEFLQHVVSVLSGSTARLGPVP